MNEISSFFLLLRVKSERLHLYRFLFYKDDKSCEILVARDDAFTQHRSPHTQLLICINKRHRVKDCGQKPGNALKFLTCKIWVAEWGHRFKRGDVHHFPFKWFVNRVITLFVWSLYCYSRLKSLHKHFIFAKYILRLHFENDCTVNIRILGFSAPDYMLHVRKVRCTLNLHCAFSCCKWKSPWFSVTGLEITSLLVNLVSSLGDDGYNVAV